ncbi:DUF5719 family protein [Streptomyces sp. LP05-1]|uniref:DUF5719 family protein n=1 Tax=Streptomyces pyxinae TaxID=2970734 RepID=A0ABT2CKH7_9ACTN|nr:DUF5719 family protein [Streptomyces sp. LP05-1]MCS0637925.1 DUF5719 family protein [Streptomyces sp. LP05-1]
MNRSSLSLLAVVTALAAVTGLAALTVPDDAPAPVATGAPARLPVERSSLLCPAPSTSEVADTVYSSFTPTGGGAGGSGRAELRPSAATPGDSTTTGKAPAKDGKAPAKDGKDGSAEGGGDGAGAGSADGTKPSGAAKPATASAKAALTLTQPGKPVTAEAEGGDAPALIGTASGPLAPGWTTQQTTTVVAGSARGLLGVGCTAPDTDFWFPGASTAKERQDYLHLTNPDDTANVVDIELYGPNGALKSDLTDGIPVPAGASVPVLLSTLTGDAPAEDVTVHVTTRSGRVGAVLAAADDRFGSDWLSASADPAGSLVLPGIPADATSVRLVVYAPGEDDADLKIRLAGPSGTITPAGAESLRVKAGMTAAVDLKDITRGEAGSLLLTPSQPGRVTPVVAALRVVRGRGDKQEVAFIPATGPVGQRATVAGNQAKGTTLSLTAPGATAQVRVTASAGSEGGAPATKTYTVKGGTTTALTAPPVPAGLKGTYALTVETVSGGPVHAARTLEAPKDGIPMFTVQPLADDRGTVAVPAAREDLSVLD